jgi:uncharacterized protein YkwD
MCKDACLVQGEVWTVAHGCGAIRAAGILMRAISGVVVAAALAASGVVAVTPANVLAASASTSTSPSTSAPRTANAQPTSHTQLAAHTQPTSKTRTEQQTACPGAELRPSHANASVIDTATLCLIDHVRVAHGLRPLLANRELQAVAISQVKEMIRLDYFSDTRPSGATPAALIAATPYGRHARRLSTAESIGWGTGRFATPAQMVAAWLGSPAHRAIVLSGELLEAGVGAVAAAPSRLTQGQSGATYALELARR